jgi:hypothetical protein
MGVEKPPRGKRRHSEEFKGEFVRACSEPGVSVVGIALANGVNAANLLRKWMGARGVTLPVAYQPQLFLNEIDTASIFNQIILALFDNW